MDDREHDPLFGPLPGGHDGQHAYAYGEPRSASYGSPYGDPATARPGPADPAASSASEVPGSPARGPVRHRHRARGRAGGRRRKAPPKRFTLLTVAVPSVALLGVAAAAVSSFAAGQHGGGHSRTDAASTAAHQRAVDGADATTPATASATTASGAAARTAVPAADRARQRAALKQRQTQDAPHDVLPVVQRGLSAYFGETGAHWLSMHTGIDFPVEPGTPVRAVTDGTVRVKWNPSYGNMVELTAPDGTQTWYCHLSAARVASGAVRAGEVIAYSGNTGNTTGPHLHFEVRPHGGAPVDPLPWLLAHGLDPR
ncbi:M23 family metallopeptidase [Streptantibioticus parmotrematis]|uniref:M23 family metallopeptidase n=1 Tax=Streptantibioticus parmotrematis TaxID=2873249 RepID=UPI0027E0592A|nr:M23 family metallopeptidase [Streptantibioticus parmotrematis]